MVVEGRVQGVWFRESVREHALASVVTGWVRNRTDGSVEAVFEGEAGAVESCVGYCRVGPPGAIVSGIQVEDQPPAGNADESDFKVIM